MCDCHRRPKALGSQSRPAQDHRSLWLVFYNPNCLPSAEPEVASDDWLVAFDRQRASRDRAAEEAAQAAVRALLATRISEARASEHGSGTGTAGAAKAARRRQRAAASRAEREGAAKRARPAAAAAATPRRDASLHAMTGRPGALGGADAGGEAEDDDLLLADVVEAPADDRACTAAAAGGAAAGAAAGAGAGLGVGGDGSWAGGGLSTGQLAASMRAENAREAQSQRRADAKTAAAASAAAAAAVAAARDAASASPPGASHAADLASYAAERARAAAEQALEGYAATPKLYFASRTHSQLAQFVAEVGKTSLAARLRVVVLGSRRTLCVNEEVAALGTDARINERCSELQEQRSAGAATAAAAAASVVGTAAAAVAAAAGGGSSAASAARSHAVLPPDGAPAAKRARALSDASVHAGHPPIARDASGSPGHTSSSGHPAAGVGGEAAAAPCAATPRGAARGCPFMADGAAQDAFKWRLLAQPADIEDALVLGDALGTCPYYGSRKALQYADVVALPYSLLLQQASRDALGLDLTGAIVVVDEAHNLVDTINATHSCTAGLPQLNALLLALRAYFTRYCARLSTRNRVQLSQLMDVLEKLGRMLTAAAARASAAATGLSPGEPPLASPLALAAGGVYSHGATPALGGAAASTGAAASVGALASPPRIFKLGELLRSAHIDHVDLFRLLRYVAAAGLMRKLRGFVERGLADGAPRVGASTSGSGGGGAGGGAVIAGAAVTAATADVVPGAGAPFSAPSAASASASAMGHGAAIAGMYTALSFLTALGNADGDCRITIHPGAGRGGGDADGARGSGGGPAGPHFKFLMLNPAVHFRPIVDAARSVILAGGTMQPIAGLVSQLFAHVPPARLTTFSCGHVIPADSLLGIAADAGPTGVPLNFRFDSRASTALLDELGRVLLNAAATVPAGMVVFLPSYEYERRIWEHWSRAPAGAAGATAGAAPTASATDSARGGSSVLAAAAARSASLPGGGTGGAGAAHAGSGHSVKGTHAPPTPDGLDGYGEADFHPGSVLAQLARRKRLFREPRSAGDMDTVLRAYSAAATSTVAAPGLSIAAAGGAGSGGGCCPIPVATAGCRPALHDAASTQAGHLPALTSLTPPASPATRLNTATTAGTAYPARVVAAVVPGTPSAPLQTPVSAPQLRNGGSGDWCAATPTAAVAAAGRPCSGTTATAHLPAVALASPAPAVAAGPGLRGALLFAVVGGKMSEGINFSDDLARCVAVVGLPFPNAADPELRERMAYLDARQAQAACTAAATSRARAASATGSSASAFNAGHGSQVARPSASPGGTPCGGATLAGGSLAIAAAGIAVQPSEVAGNSAGYRGGLPAGALRRPSGVDGGAVAATGSGAAVAPAPAVAPSATAGREYYESLCMRAVNQSIGRAIRHASDHAAILLLDQRYSTPRIRSKLPAWIEHRVVHCSSWGAAVGQLGRFYRHQRELKAAVDAAARAPGGETVAASAS